MWTDGQEGDAHHLLREIEVQLEALARVIERAIEHWAADGTDHANIERLYRAKQAAEHGATLAGRNAISHRG
jgi:hypothetical protein